MTDAIRSCSRRVPPSTFRAEAQEHASPKPTGGLPSPVTGYRLNGGALPVRPASPAASLPSLEVQGGDRGKALGWLRQSVEAGYADADWMAKDSDLESLHGPEFDALIERARRNAADRRAK